MGGWLKSEDPRALSKMQEVLAVMEQSYEEGNEEAKPDRVTMPDFDIDFCKSRRDEVIEYVQKKYGFQNSSKIH